MKEAKTVVADGSSKLATEAGCWGVLAALDGLGAEDLLLSSRHVRPRLRVMRHPAGTAMLRGDGAGVSYGGDTGEAGNLHDVEASEASEASELRRNRHVGPLLARALCRVQCRVQCWVQCCRGGAVGAGSVSVNPFHI